MEESGKGAHSAGIRKTYTYKSEAQDSPSSYQWDEQMPTLVNVVPSEVPSSSSSSPSKDQHHNEIRCLICYNLMITSDTLKPFSGKEIYDIFNLKTKHSEDFDDPGSHLPFCSICTQLVGDAKEFMVKLEELQKLLEQLRQQLRDKVLTSFEQHDVRTGNRDAAAELKNKMMVDVEIIRQDVLISIKRQLGTAKKPGRPKRESQNQNQPQLKNSEDKTTTDEKPSKSILSLPDPFVLLGHCPTVPIEPTRSKAGRVIKRPERLMMIPIPVKYNDPTPPVAEVNKPSPKECDDVKIKQEIEPEVEDEDDDIPDPEWSPGVDLDEENEVDDDEATNSSMDDDGEDDDEEFALHIVNRTPASRSEPGKISQKSQVSKSRMKQKRSFKPLPKSNLKPSKISIQVTSPSGEKLDAYYVPEENATDSEIQEGSIITILNSNAIPPGVRVLCPEKCSKTFRNLNKMRIHVKTAHLGETNQFDCLTCGRNFDSRRNLRIHAKIHGELPPSLQKRRTLYSCTIEGCETNQKYRSVNDLNVHVRSCHTHEKPFKCDSCEESFVSVPKRELHIEQNHPEVPPFKCSHCPKAFFREHRHREHTKTHTGEKPWLCEICSKSFSQQSYLKYHQTKHAELDLEPYKCAQCEKTFATPVNLQQHLRTQHENQYRYRCQVCNHGADHLSHLRLHMLTHSGERPHVCECCGKSFSRASQLKIHMRNHTGERPYVCPTCTKSFTNSSKLRRHQLTHSDVKPHSCEICHKGFTQLTNLNSHINSAHKGGQRSAPRKNADKEEFMMEVVEHVEQSDNVADPGTHTIELQPQTVFQSQVFGIQSQNFANMPIQFQVLTDDTIQGDGDTSYAEFIIVNQI